MHWKSLLPDSLFARLLMALLAVIAVAFLAVLGLILRERRELSLLASDARSTAQTIVETTEYLAKVPLDQRGNAITTLRPHPESEVPNYLFPPGVPGSSGAQEGQILQRRRAEEAAAEKAFVAQVQRRLGRGYTVTAGPPAPASDDNVVDLRQGRQMASYSRPPMMLPDMPLPSPPPLMVRFFDLRVVLPDHTALIYRTFAPRHGPPLPPQIFVNLTVLALLLTAVLYFMTRTITRPIADLERAAGAIGRGMSETRLEEKGARELRGAARAFNAMQDRIRRYLDSRTRVLAAMSHDLRTPLTRLRLRIESIDNESLRAQCVHDVDEMSAMISGALGIFRGLNDEEAADPVDLNALLAALQREYGEMGHEVTVRGVAHLPITAKPLALRRCLGNLLQNAIRYGKRAHVTVEDGASLTVRISDEGPGIPEELLEQVFEPFFRLETSRNRDLGGTGLGLSIARDIAQAHGGSLTLHNLPQGLEAVLVLPRSKQ